MKCFKIVLKRGYQHGDVAHMVERSLCMREVRGSDKGVTHLLMHIHLKSAGRLLDYNFTKLMKIQEWNKWMTNQIIVKSKRVLTCSTL